MPRHGENIFKRKDGRWEGSININPTFFKDIVLPLVQEKLKNKNEIKNENSDDIKAGAILNNRYELLKQIGLGGLSTVYLARDIRLNKMWAVKVVKAKRNNQSNLIFNSVIQEAQMMKLFSHPAIPNIVDIVACQNSVAIVMDYVEGETLETIVKKYGAQPVDRVVDWAKQICDVLCYLHSFNLPYIHRDIKPGNLILEPKGTIKLIDFGIIRQYDLMKDSDTCFLGTKGYIYIILRLYHKLFYDTAACYLFDKILNLFSVDKLKLSSFCFIDFAW